MAQQTWNVFEFEGITLLNHKLSAVNGTCPYHPNTFKPLPSPLPTNVSIAIESVEKIFNNIIDSNTAPGAVFGIQYTDTFQYTQGIGVKDKSSPAELPGADTIFRIGSVSKIFVVITLFQLHHEGLVNSLDDPLVHYCLRFSIRDPYAGNSDDDVVTLRQLASQLSGMPREAPCYGNATAENSCPLDTIEILQRLSLQYRVLPSWTVPSYSNLAYSLLGRCIVQKVHPATSYEEYVEKRILQPLGLTDTGFDYTENVQFSHSITSKMATGYDSNGKKAPLTDFGWDAPSGQMYSTINDLLKVSTFLNSAYGSSKPINEILPANSVREMGLPVFLNYDGNTLFGTPWEMNFIDTYLVRGKGGDVPGYSAMFGYVPELGLGLSVLVSGTVNLDSVMQAAYNGLIPVFHNFMVTNAATEIPYPPIPIPYTGNYSCPLSSISVNIYTKSKTLYADFNYGNGSNKLSFTPALKYHGELELQVYFVTSQMDCLLGEELALNNAWMYFEEPNIHMVSPGFYFPILQCKFTRINYN